MLHMICNIYLPHRLEPIQMKNPNPCPTNEEADMLANQCRALMNETYVKLKV